MMKKKNQNVVLHKKDWAIKGDENKRNKSITSIKKRNITNSPEYHQKPAIRIIYSWEER